MKDVIFLVHSGDKSERIWDYWYYYWKKYFTCQEFMDTVFLSENITKDYSGVKFYHTGNVPWSNGLIEFLKKIEAKYIVYQHEDYFLTEETNHKEAERLINICRDKDLNLLKTCSLWAGNPNWQEDGAFEKTDIEGIEIYSNNQPYLISHQTSIWKRSFLLSTLYPGWDPWSHELKGTPKVRKRKIPIHAFRGKNPWEYAETMQHANVRDGFEPFFEIDLEVNNDNNS